MPADPTVIQQSRVWFGGYDISGQLNSVMLKAGRVELPDARLTDDYAATFPGIQQVDAQVEGFYSAGAGEADTVAASRIITKDAAEWPLTILPPYATAATPGADGNIGYNLRSAQFAMTFGAEHGKSLPFSLKSMARTGRLDRPTVMLPKALISVTTTGTAVQLGALTAAQKLVAILHVFAVNGGSWVATVESDSVGFGSPLTRGTFVAATGITREVIEIAGPITDDYWRVVVTKTGGTSCTPAVLFAVVAA